MAAVAVVPAVANIKPYDTKEPFGALFLCVRFYRGNGKHPRRGDTVQGEKGGRDMQHVKEKTVSDKGKKRDKGENIGIDIYEKGRGERASE